jgi:glycosyltransferase involved in cell wall biosynthesis
LGEALEAICNQSLKPDEVIVVDDASIDGTRELLTGLHKELHFNLILQEKNQGKGAAIRRALEKTTGDIVIIQDADLEYDPNDYPGLIQPILDNKADVVYGTRFLGDRKRFRSFWHYLGNKFLTFMSNMFTKLKLTDMETCYKAFRGNLIRSITISSNRFGFEPEITAKIALAGARVLEV